MRRHWLRSTYFVAALCAVTAAAPAPLAAREIKLEDKSLLVAFDSRSGALTRLVDKAGDWTIERRPKLGVSFRLFVPLPEQRYNPVLGQKQTAAAVKKISDHEVRLQWKDLKSENGGVLPIAITAVVSLTNGVLTFNTTLQNDSALTVETMDYPYLGDCNAPSRDSSLVAYVARNNNRQSDEIYPHFRNEKGYWGVFYPLKTREARQNPYCLIQAPTEGLYAGIDGTNLPYRLEYTFEQHPGVVSAVTALVPQEDAIAGTPVHLEFRTCHFVFTGPHTSTNLAPILLRCYQGDSQAGADIYKEWHSAIAH
jgi:hypothetical protein